MKNRKNKIVVLGVVPCLFAGTIYEAKSMPGWGNAAIGIGAEGKIKYTLWDKSMTTGEWQAQFPNVMAARPMLILDGVTQFDSQPQNKAELTHKMKYNIYTPRTAIGSKADGTIVLIVIDGRNRRAYGASFTEMATIGKWLGLTNMMNLDGGGSSAMIYQNRVINFSSD